MMVVTRLEILQHVLIILEVEKEGQKILIDHETSSVRNLLNDTYDAYQYMSEEEYSKLFELDKEQFHLMSLVLICLLQELHI